MGRRRPGIVLNTWPDQWYHTSEDRPDKLDATQLKRAVAVTAAAAWIIATADDRMAGQIAAEIVANAAADRPSARPRHRRDETRAAGTLPAVYKKVRGYIEAAAINERATLDSVAQLATDKAGFARDLAELRQVSVDDLEAGPAPDRWTRSMRRQAAGLGLKPAGT